MESRTLKIDARHPAWLVGVLLLLVFWGTRLGGLDMLPLHNDEGLHIRRAVEVWDGHPFWDISDGKIINHWPIAAFYPQNKPVFAGRVPTVLVSMLGLAAGYALAYRLFGLWAGLLAGILWLTSPYLFFFERLALSDSQAGSWIVVMLWLLLCVVERGRWHMVILAGLTLATAVLFKFTAVPYALLPLFLLLFGGNWPLRWRVTRLIVIGVVAGLCFVPPLLYLLLRGNDFFGIALGWVGVASNDGTALAFAANIQRLEAQLVGYGTFSWAVVLLLGLLLLGLLGRRTGRALLAAGLLPLLIIIVFGSEVLPRHYVVALPLLFTLSGMGIGAFLNSLNENRERWVTALLLIALLTVSFFPFWLQSQQDAGRLMLPQAVQTQYVTDHSSGYGLREAMLALPELIPANTTVIASMFPDSCRRANFYAADGFALTCVSTPGLAEIEQALESDGVVYVLVDNAPLIGVDVSTLAVDATPLGVYPRPGETTESASVVLWRLQR